MAYANAGGFQHPLLAMQQYVELQWELIDHTQGIDMVLSNSNPLFVGLCNHHLHVLRFAQSQEQHLLYCAHLTLNYHPWLRVHCDRSGVFCVGSLPYYPTIIAI
jgi:hypothetical protein